MRKYRPADGPVRRRGDPLWPLVVVLLLLAAVAVAAVSWLREIPPPQTGSTDTGTSTAADPDGDDSPVVADVDAGGGPVPDAGPGTPAAPAEPVSTATPAPPSPAPVSPDSTAPADVMAGPLLVRRATPAPLTAALARLTETASPEALASVAAHAQAGWPEAQTALALHLAAGDIVGRDVERALALFERAAAAGDAAAQYALGRAYLTGAGVQADAPTALAWFIVAASRGHAEALTARDRDLAGLSAADRARAFDLSRHLGAGAVAGWSRDPDSGVAVWLPSWFRNGSYALRAEVPAEAGYAHGFGKVVLKGSRPGDSDRTFEGHFNHGHFHGARLPEAEIHFLETDDFLVRLPASGDSIYAGAGYWLRTDYGVQIAADPCYVAINRKPDILAVVPADFPAMQDTAVEGVMREGWRLYQELCPERYHANIYVVPPSFERRRQLGRMALEYAPLFASASFYGKLGEKLSIGRFENLARRTQEKAEAETARQRQRQVREDRHRRATAAAATRGNPNVRGLRLGMTLAEVRSMFQDEIAAWEPPWNPGLPPAGYRQFRQSIGLSDGARIEARFTAPVNGSLLFAFSYEQRLRQGIDRGKLVADLKAKYGEPDDYGAGDRYWTYKLVSRQPEETPGAFLKVTIRSSESAPEKVDLLRLVVNDAGFGSYDERAAFAAERQEKARRYEAETSDKPKF